MGGALSNVAKNGVLPSRCSSGSMDNATFRFHQVHGDNIVLSQNSTVATRSDSFCKGVTFSNRPVLVNEKVWVKFVEIATSWSGSFRFGFTNHDPATMRGFLPKYACPDLTNRVGHWAKALPENMIENNSVIFFYFTHTGDVHFGINNVDNGIFFSGVDTQNPLWAILDIYGNTVAVQIVEAVDQHLNNQMARTSIEHEDLEASSVVQPFSEMSIGNTNDHAGRGYSAQSELFHLHVFHGRNIRLSEGYKCAERLDTEFAQGYVFTAMPLPLNRWLVIQISHTDEHFVGALAFGLTSCNPAMLMLTDNDLPDDADNLMDRPEYWVVCKDVANTPASGDKLAFHITSQGEVLFSKNEDGPTILIHVDQTQPLWAFFDVYGNTRKIKVLGLRQSDTLTTFNLSASSSRCATPPGGSAVDGSKDNATNECTVCYERAVDSVLYTCGHMCMCYTCAVQQWKCRVSGQCPICRADIKDVIRIYRS